MKLNQRRVELLLQDLDTGIIQLYIGSKVAPTFGSSLSSGMQASLRIIVTAPIDIWRNGGSCDGLPDRADKDRNCVDYVMS
jgi:hypothetical protein